MTRADLRILISELDNRRYADQLLEFAMVYEEEFTTDYVQEIESAAWPLNSIKERMLEELVKREVEASRDETITTILNYGKDINDWNNAMELVHITSNTDTRFRIKITHRKSRRSSSVIVTGDMAYIYTWITSLFKQTEYILELEQIE